jgi:hypothetical protein
VAALPKIVGIALFVVAMDFASFATFFFVVSVISLVDRLLGCLTLSRITRQARRLGCRKTRDFTDGFLFIVEIGNEILGVVLGHVVNAADLVLVADSVTAVCDCDKLLTESADNELSRSILVICLTLDKASYCCPIR